MMLSGTLVKDLQLQHDTLLDVLMPRMCGFEFARQTYSIHSETKNGEIEFMNDDGNCDHDASIALEHEPIIDRIANIYGIVHEIGHSQSGS
jgi:hypothetical protein